DRGWRPLLGTVSSRPLIRARRGRIRYIGGGAMVTWRTLGSLIVALVLSGSVQAQTCTLTEAPLADSYFDLHLTLDLVGELRVQKADKVVPIKQTVTARHDYRERVLEAPADGPAV